MNKVTFSHREYGEGHGTNAVALIAGFDGRINDFDRTARDLVCAGNDVVVYKYDTSIFLEGDARLLPSLIEDLSQDFLARTRGHPTHQYAGASIGGGIGWNMQKRSPDAQPGLYAAIGADVAHAVMSNPLFRGVVRLVHKVDPRKQFERNGYTEADLFEEWKELHAPPITGFAVALGGMDYVIRQREVIPKFNKWKESIGISIITKRRLGHAGIIKWFTENTPTMLDLAQEVNTAK